jgi:hypothetical protein
VLAHQRLATEPGDGDARARPPYHELQQQQSLDRIRRRRHGELTVVDPLQALPFLFGHHGTFGRSDPMNRQASCQPMRFAFRSGVQLHVITGNFYQRRVSLGGSCRQRSIAADPSTRTIEIDDRANCMSYALR